MKKILFAFAIFSQVSYGQPLASSLQSMIDAENGFAALSKNKDTRDRR